MDDHEHLLWLLPQHQPDQWTPDQRIDLLPALRMQYLGWVLDEVLRVELVFEKHREPPCPSYFLVARHEGVMCIPEEVRTSVYHVMQSDKNCDDDWSTHGNYPHEIIDFIMDPQRVHLVQATLNIFKLGVVPSIDIIGSRLVKDIEKRRCAEQNAASEHIKFLADWVRSASRHIARQTDLEALTVSCLKKYGAWEFMISEGHALRDIGLESFSDGIESAVYEVFSELPRAAQLSLWANHGLASELLSASDWVDIPDEGIEKFPLFEKHEMLDEVVRDVWYTACAAASDRAKEADAASTCEQEDDDA